MSIVEKKKNVLDFKILNHNVRYIKRKKAQFESELAEIKPDFVCVTEMALLAEEIENFRLENYEFLTSFCRKGNRGGGVGLFVSSQLFQKVSITEINVSHWCHDKIFEAAAINVGFKNRNFSLIGVYRSPNDNLTVVEDFFDRLNGVLGEVSQGYVVVTGDLNICLNTAGSKRDMLGEFASYHNLSSLLPVGSVTRSCSTTDSCLDLILSDWPNTESKILKTFISDHYAVLSTFKNAFHSSQEEAERRKFSEEAHAHFSSLLTNRNWSDVLTVTDANEAYNRFHSVMTTCFELAFPKKWRQTKFAAKYPRFSPNAIALKQKLKECGERYHITWSDSDRDKLNEVKLQYTQELNKCKARDNLNYIKESTNKSKAFWDVINKDRYNENGKKFNQIVLQDGDGQFLSDQCSVAEKLNVYFTGSIEELTAKNDRDIETLNEETVPGPCLASDNTQSMFLHPTDVEEVLKISKALSNSKATGPDELPTNLIKQHVMCIAEVLVHLINLSFGAGIYPDKLKIAKIMPLFKGGEASDVKRYRPLALNSVFSKFYERAFLIRLRSFVEKKKIISKNQYGYQNNRSTTDALISAFSKILDNLDRDVPTAAILLDLTRAFECVKHEVLITKLENHGIRGYPLEWLQSFLRGRQQYVQISRSEEAGSVNRTTPVTSSLKPVNHGVPTGSILGPFLYILYVNGLIDENMTVYCDDTTVICTAPKAEDLSAVCSSSLSNLGHEFLRHNLLINTKKSNLMVFGRNNEQNIVVNYNDENLHVVKETRFLGVVVDVNFQWKTEISSLRKKLLSAIFVIWNVTRSSNREAAILAYHSLFMSRVSYSLLVWGNSSSGNLLTIFKLQKRAVRTIRRMGRRDSCRGVFKEMNLLTVPALYCYQVAKWAKFKGDFTLGSQVHGHNTRNGNRIFVEPHRTKRFEQSLNFVGRKVLNSIPIEIVSDTSYPNFCRKLRLFLTDLEMYDLTDLWG